MRHLIFSFIVAAVGCAKASGPEAPAAEESAMMVIRVVIDVVPEQREAFVEYLEREALAVRELEGCERYELFEDAGGAHRFLLYEEWSTPDAFEAYRTSDMLKQSFAVLGPMMAGPPDSAYFHATRAE